MTDYATATEIKAFTRVTFEDFRNLTTTQFDTLVALLAGFASRSMESYCKGRDWASHDDTTSGLEFSVGPQNQRLIRINGPVIAITSVETRTGPGATWSTLDTDLYSYDNFPKFGPAAKSPITHLKRVGFGFYETARTPRYAVRRYGSIDWERARNVFYRGYDNVRVKYTWGYATIPEEINRICIFIVDAWLKRLLQDTVKKRVKIATPEDVEQFVRVEIPDNLKESLNPWRNTGGIHAV